MSCASHSKHHLGNSDIFNTLVTSYPETLDFEISINTVGAISVVCVCYPFVTVVGVWYQCGTNLSQAVKIGVLITGQSKQFFTTIADRL